MTSAQQTPFEISGGKRSATYQEAISFYKMLDIRSGLMKMQEIGETDAPYPLHIVYISADGKFTKDRVRVLINNGIHAGEPDGIDASMMLARDIADKKYLLPANVVLAIIPVYNIGGALNRNATTRVNQNGPEEYGFRGNSNNYDLNRDFTKSDSKEAQTFTAFFQEFKPHVFIDNHVSDGADYQHVMTLITTQYEKLGGSSGNWLREVLDPALNNGMKKKGHDMIPYIDFGAADIRKSGVTMFNEPPRYGSGYAALFGTLSFVAETHMLKPFAERVKATYDLLTVLTETASGYAGKIIELQQQKNREIAAASTFALRFIPDSTRQSSFEFKGYEADSIRSEVTGLPRIKYNHAKPFTAAINYRSYYKPINMREKPRGYIVPVSQTATIERLKLNRVPMVFFEKDTMLNVVCYMITNNRSSANIYEGHHRNSGVAFTRKEMTLHASKGDVMFLTGYATDRYLVEMLEPDGDDSFFSWGFYDTYLQQKEGYSDYRWEDEASKVLQENDSLRRAFEEKKTTDKAFASNSQQILYWIYQNSKWREKEFMRYPIFRVEDH